MSDRVAIQILPHGSEQHLPRRMSDHAAGFDVRAALADPVELKPLQRRLIPCGFAMAMPEDFECAVRPRSGLAVKHGITVLNGPGTIDADYRGEVHVLLVNLGESPYRIEPGERIGQLVFGRYASPQLDTVDQLPTSGRGTGGFGSTG